eukprot:5390050-Amphidinium_carterae.1
MVAWMVLCMLISHIVLSIKSATFKDTSQGNHPCKYKLALKLWVDRELTCHQLATMGTLVMMHPRQGSAKATDM